MLDIYRGFPAALPLAMLHADRRRELLAAARNAARHLDREFRSPRRTRVDLTTGGRGWARFSPRGIRLGTRSTWSLQDLLAHEYAHLVAGVHKGSGRRNVAHGERFYRALLACIKAQGRDVRLYCWELEYAGLQSRARRDGFYVAADAASRSV